MNAKINVHKKMKIYKRVKLFNLFFDTKIFFFSCCFQNQTWFEKNYKKIQNTMMCSRIRAKIRCKFHWHLRFRCQIDVIQNFVRVNRSWKFKRRTNECHYCVFQLNIKKKITFDRRKISKKKIEYDYFCVFFMN